ncbi:conjugal transfer protein [Pseudomonas peli]|nr:conjugal transfer protein [Pseudomonas peli]NMZ71378.1 conjugal transfer protein [Pseudomonas peli]
MAMFFYNYAVAAGGLDEATNQANEIKTWAYGFLGVGVFIYLIYLVVMALLDRKQWADVLVGVGYVAIAGAIIVVGEWAWSIWGS